MSIIKNTRYTDNYPLGINDDTASVSSFATLTKSASFLDMYELDLDPSKISTDEYQEMVFKLSIQSTFSDGVFSSAEVLLKVAVEVPYYVPPSYSIFRNIGSIVMKCCMLEVAMAMKNFNSRMS